ncbi:hypothetical protein GOBAR_DD04356 [Gossypium barbadense]|nr:hypothetical protein GOBAR_DD04356 [Gossypium barbadense]
MRLSHNFRARGTLPHNSCDQLGMILLGCLEKPANFLYHYCRIALRPFTLLEFEREERVGSGTHLLLTSTNPRVIGGAGDNQGSEAEKVSVEAVKDFPSPLRYLLSEVGALELKYAEARDKELVDTQPSNDGDESEECEAEFVVEKKSRSFALANCVRGRDSSPTNLDFTVRSFAFANYIGGRDSSPVNLDFTVGSFALANCVRGRGSSLTNLDFTVGSFALANYFGGRGSSPVNLDFIAGNFVLANCIGDRGALPANIDFTAESFTLTNCMEVLLSLTMLEVTALCL